MTVARALNSLPTSITALTSLPSFKRQNIFIYQILPISLIFLLVICVPCPRSYCSLYHVNLYVLLLLLQLTSSFSSSNTLSDFKHWWSGTATSLQKQLHHLNIITKKVRHSNKTPKVETGKLTNNKCHSQQIIKSLLKLNKCLTHNRTTTTTCGRLLKMYWLQRC